jgi:hypothetical protein
VLQHQVVRLETSAVPALATTVHGLLSMAKLDPDGARLLTTARAELMEHDAADRPRGWVDERAQRRNTWDQVITWATSEGAHDDARGFTFGRAGERTASLKVVKLALRELGMTDWVEGKNVARLVAPPDWGGQALTLAQAAVGLCRAARAVFGAALDAPAGGAGGAGGGGGGRGVGRGRRRGQGRGGRGG